MTTETMKIWNAAKARAEAPWETCPDCGDDFRVTHQCDAMPPCFKCGGIANQWFDGPAATNRRPICAACEYKDWKATAASYNEVEIG